MLTGTAMLLIWKPHGRANAMLSSTHPSWLSTNVARNRAMAAGSPIAGGAGSGAVGSGGISGPPAATLAMISLAAAAR
jgi:hypothetical protein